MLGELWVGLSKHPIIDFFLNSDGDTFNATVTMIKEKIKCAPQGLGPSSFARPF